MKSKQAVSFETVEDASRYLAGLADGEYEIETSTKKNEYVDAFVIAMQDRRLNAIRLKKTEVHFDWNLIGPATYSISISGNELIPLVWKSRADELRERIAALSDGGRLDCTALGYDPNYIRVALSNLGVQAYTKTENGSLYVVKGTKPLSALKTIQSFALALGDAPAVLVVDKNVQYVRTNLSKIKTEGYGFSVRELASGQYLVHKRYNKPTEPERFKELFRDKLASVLSPDDLAAYDAIMSRAAAAITASFTPNPVPAVSVEAEEIPKDWLSNLANVPQRPGAVDDDKAGTMEGFVESAPCYMTPVDVNDEPSADDPDDYDPKKLSTSYLNELLPDDDDLPF